ncbi:MAG: hypothetical protein K0Q94_1859 [Paenibacillus sp.]|nr:hypothetical protein [Paenibacillus sp.]
MRRAREETNVSIKEQDSEREERVTEGQAVPSAMEWESAASAISRRKLLASIGVTGMMLTTGTWLTGRMSHASAGQSSVMESVYGEGLLNLPEDTNLIIVTTLSELRLLNAPVEQFLYFVADTGQEGHFSMSAAEAGVGSGGIRSDGYDYEFGLDSESLRDRLQKRHRFQPGGRNLERHERILSYYFSDP